MDLKLEEYRRSKNISIRELAKRSGISKTYISDIESGKCSNPGVKVICSLCRILDITPNELIDEKLWK